MRYIRNHLTFANVVSVIALFIALGGTAAASVIISSNSQVAPSTISGHKPPTGKHSNIITGSVNATDLSANSINTSKVTNGSLTGSDLANGTVASSKLQLPKISWSGPDTDPVDDAPHHTALAMDGVTVETSCFPDSALGELTVFVSSSTSGTLRGTFAPGSDGSVTSVKLVNKSVSSTPVAAFTVENAVFSGEFTYSDSHRVITFNLDGNATAPSCDLHGTVVPAPN